MVSSFSIWDEVWAGFTFNIGLLTFLYSFFLYQFAASHYIQIYYMRLFMDVGSYCFGLKASSAQVWRVTSLCMTTAKVTHRSLASYTCASPHASCLSTAPSLPHWAWISLYYVLCEPQMWQNHSGTIQGLDICTICTASSQLQDTSYSRRAKTQRKEGLEKAHSTVLPGQCLQAISYNTNMVHVELHISFPQQQQYWWSQTAFLCLHLIKPVPHCQTLICCTTK